MDSVYTLEVSHDIAPRDDDQREAFFNPNYVPWKRSYKVLSTHQTLQAAKRAGDQDYRIGGPRFIGWSWFFTDDAITAIGMDMAGGRNVYYRIRREGELLQLQREELLEAIREAELSRDEAPEGSLARFRDEEIIAECRVKLEALDA